MLLRVSVVVTQPRLAIGEKMQRREKGDLLVRVLGVTGSVEVSMYHTHHLVARFSVITIH